jgi:SAM-dependent methyltransferase
VYALQLGLYAVQLVLFCVLAIMLFRFIVRALSSFTDVPYVPTEYSFLPKIAEALDIKPNDIVYDLGSGDGRLLFYCAERYPQAKFVGIEQNLLLVYLARCIKLLLRTKNVEVRRGNIFNANISDATRIFVFLLPEVMRDVKPMLKAPRIVSRAFEIPHRYAQQEFKLREAPEGPGNTYTVYIYS